MSIVSKCIHTHMVLVVLKRAKLWFFTCFIAIYFVLLCFHVAQAGLQVLIAEVGIGTLPARS